MKYLLDTHVFLWWIEKNRKLSAKISEVIANPQNYIFVSVINAAEISIKSKLNKLPLKTSLENTMNEPDFELLPLTLSHIIEFHKLPLHHKDPFDRILIAQALTEKLTLITHDQKFTKYKVDLLLT